MYADVQKSDRIEHCTFSKNGKLEQKPRRESPKSSEKEVDFQKMNELCFDSMNCDAFKWLQTLFGNEKITKENSRAIAELAAFLINDDIPLGYYRRSKTMILWIQEHLEEIAKAFSDYPTTFTYRGKTIIITPPSATNN